ncbi:glycoside hydrolase family 2 protein [Variovorax dokdonensis]|uniref:Glycoside hydrolase family 2 protein n=1 Tax=Variovorax dokdonensis TaxID=344883 RepID=A0ABT7NFC0_9BURK|nr:glycoside hydrolase family 2 protein [Variovorax dokdonensis]MDM0046650.1 glycoside hydrolase family 2 protein [Variovorax dokdonensis]
MNITTVDDDAVAARVRAVLAKHGRLSQDIASLSDDASLSEAGMTSHASVNVMLALESEFGEIPDHMLTGPDGPRDGWIGIARAQPVAAALAELGQFSLDAPARDFDDEVAWYRAEFDAPADPPISLAFDGLASIVDIWLNGEALLSSANMFRRWEVPLAGRLRPKGNLLLLRFDALNARLREARPRPRWRVPMLQQQQLRWWRTTLLGRTPGWSPPVAVVGPWLAIRLVSADARRLEVIRQRVWLDGDAGRYQVEIAMSCMPRQATVRLRRGGIEAQAPFVACVAPSEAGPLEAGEGPAFRLQAKVSVAQVQPWRPHTHGEPALYEAWIEWTDGQGESHRHELAHIGFRQIEIDRGNDGFAVRVNGAQVFCRGACWTPLDPLRLRAEPQAYDAAIRQLRDAGMNMVRVVGAMVWESAALFEACDRHGVMVWQDLMLANMDYPGEDLNFAHDLHAEVTQQLHALQAHPSLALVCGSSEVEQQAAMYGAPAQSWRPVLFHEVVPRWVAQALPDTAYWPSSASGGDFPHQPAQGTCSYYGVGAYRRGLDDARHSGLRFASECLAFANIPADDALARMPRRGAVGPHSVTWKSRVPRDLGAGWDFDDVRDHYVEHLFGECAQALRATDPARYLALGRAASAEAMSRAFVQWRASDSRCGGALVWFLRDLWPGAGWGLLDDQGEPKAAFRALARVLQPIWLGWIDNGLNGLELHWANEGAAPVDATVEVHAWRHGRQPAARGAQPLHMPARGRGRIALSAMLDGFIDLNWAYRFGPVPAELVRARLLGTDGREQANALHFPPHLIARRGAVGLACRSSELPDGGMQLHLSTQSAALGVHFDISGWVPNDEYFHMEPGEEKVVTLRPRSAGARPLWNGCVLALNTHEILPI